MAKRRTRRVRPMQEPTRKLTGEEKERQAAFAWKLKQKSKPKYSELVRVIARDGLVETYRAALKAAGETG